MTTPLPPWPGAVDPVGSPPPLPSPLLPPANPLDPAREAGNASANMAMALGLFLLSVWFWDSWPVYPVKLLTVFFHELSHGIAAIISGGKIVSIELSANEGGLCRTLGGNPWLLYLAGYLGSLLWGSAILLVASRTRWDRELVQFLGGLLVAVTVIWVRSTAGVLFGLGFGLGLLLFARYFGERPCDVLLRYIGLTSSFYVILDIKSDLIDRSIPASDAYRLAEMLPLPRALHPDLLVGGAWFLLALFLTWHVLKAALKDDAPGGGGR